VWLLLRLRSSTWPTSVPDAAGPLIAAVETTTVSARAKPALRVRGARVVHDASTFALVRVVTDDGVEGFGEVSATAAWSGEDAVTATHFIRNVLGPVLIGRPLAPIEAHATEFDRVLRGNWFTKAGVSTALWDALGRSRGVTVAELLGGPYRREVPVKISLSGDGDDLRAGYEAAVGLGFRSFKVKVGRDPGADAARVALARELAGDDALVGADANGGWTLPVALETVPRLAESRIAFIEQPVRADDLEGLREVRALGVPLIADESVYSPADVLRIGRLGAADIVSIYVGKSSALERAVEAARLAGELGMDVVIGANGEMGLGAAAQLHVACACERISEIPHGIIGQHFYEGDATLAEPLDIDGVLARLPGGPGLGVEPSDDVRRSFSS
jgi:L-alanine-DL-glutamate epimerase-like enolase superfamily enzyme